MPKNERDDADVVKLEGSATGVKAHIPLGLLDRIAPITAAKGRVTAAIGHQISEKLSKGLPLSEVEAFFFTTFFEKEMKRHQRKLRTKEMMEKILREEPAALPPTTDEAHVLDPAEDAFADRFWEDVEQTTDENIRELYARVGLWEDRRPGSFSLRTLSVLRDLDRHTKTTFETLCEQFILGGDGILRVESTSVLDIYEERGIAWKDLLAVEDAGLLTLRADTGTNYITSPTARDVIRIDIGHIELQIRRPDGMPFSDGHRQIPIHPLTKAGTELARLIPRRAIYDRYILAVFEFLQNRNTQGDKWSHEESWPDYEIQIEWRRRGDPNFRSVDTLGQQA